jgi:hypothetical protein
MTSLDTINLDDYQDLSIEEQDILTALSPPVKISTSSWSPLIVGIVTVLLWYIFSSDWLAAKLQDVPYYKFGLAGLLFATVVLMVLFLG